jgi:RNA recognition motif-containing protein
MRPGNARPIRVLFHTAPDGLDIRSCSASQWLRKEFTMSKKLYVGNLAFGTTGDDLTEAFGQYGTVQSAQIVTDRDTGRSRGFGFVEMSDGAEQAIAKLNGADFQGRALTVNEARPREDRARSGGDRPRSGGYNRR